MNDTIENSGNSRFLFWIIALCTGAVAVVGAILVTEVGQMLNLPRDWVVGYFHYRQEFSIAIGMATLLLIVWQLRATIVKRGLGLLYIAGIAVCLFIINSFVPDYWLRSQQHDAHFISVAEADLILDEHEDVFVLEINGDARAYPRDGMQIPHFAGDTVGGEEVVMSYCALSNLPRAFSTQVDGEEADFKVIAQVHNNLIFTDENSGELYQQITATGEFNQNVLDQYPVQRMPWSSFRALYPDGKVFRFEPNALDKVTLKLFETALPKHYDGEPMFPTLSMEDDRLPPEERIWGLDIDGEQVAIARSLFDDDTVVETEVGEQPVLLVWYPDLEMLGAFLYEPDDGVPGAEDIDPYGNTPSGQLTRANLVPGVFWMIWSHWYPNTAVMD